MPPAEGPRIAIVDYGMGNLASVRNALLRLGADALIAREPRLLEPAGAYVLPGVGAFPTAMDNLARFGLIELLHTQVLEKRKPVLGICLGMQLFAERSSELGSHGGLGWLPGSVERIEPGTAALRVPHVGWNQSRHSPDASLFARVAPDTHFYFDHSYRVVCPDEFVVSRVDYGAPLVAAVAKGNVFGVQFHPERSQSAGLKVLRNFLNIAAEARPAAC